MWNWGSPASFSRTPVRPAVRGVGVKKEALIEPPSGAGRARTAVQTGDKPAFYMLIRWLVVGVALDIGTQGHP